MAKVLGIIGSLLLLTLLVVIHEWGHFFVGRKLGFIIEEFSVGYGPRILKKVKSGIEYSLRCLPIGGYVRFYGDFEEDEPAPELLKRGTPFNKMPCGKRALLFSAGPLMNLIFALVLTVVILCAFGDYAPVVAGVTEGSPAQAAGLQAGDQLVEVDGRSVDFYTEFQLDTSIIQGGEGDVVNIVVERDGQRIAQDVSFAYNEEYGRHMIGITYGPARVFYGFFEAVGLAFKWLYINVVAIINAIVGALFLGQGAELMTGPVGTIDLMSEIVRTGFENVCRIAALISINLGVINLFPIPALDGGKLLLLGVEKLRRRPLSVRWETALNLVGFALVILAMVALTIQDISRLVGA